MKDRSRDVMTGMTLECRAKNEVFVQKLKKVGMDETKGWREKKISRLVR